MATWDQAIPIIVRNLINDTSSTSQQFDDSRIKESIVVAGLIVAQEYSFNTTYSFDMVNTEISPDPIVEGDSLAVALFSLKAACLLNINQYQGSVKLGIKVKDWNTEYDPSVGFKGYQDIITNGPCKSYQSLLQQSRFNKSMSSGKAIATPISHIDYVWSLSSFGTRDLFDRFVYRT